MALVAPSLGMTTHQRRRLDMRTVSAASASMLWARKAATARAESQRRCRR